MSHDFSFHRLADGVRETPVPTPVVEYPVVLWRGRDTAVKATVRVPLDLTLAEVEIIARILRAVASGGAEALDSAKGGAA
jgi:hypothetical protein